MKKPMRRPKQAGEGAPEKTGLRTRMGQLADFIKDAGVIFAVVATPVAFVLVLTWTSFVRPWLASELFVELKDQSEEKAYDELTTELVLRTLTDFDDDLVAEWTALSDPIITRLDRAPTSEDIEALFELPEFRQLFLREVLMALLNRKEDKVDQVLVEYANKDLVENWLQSQVSDLSQTVVQQVDDVHVRRMYFKYGKDEDESPDANTVDRFYASRNQIYTLEVDVNAFDHFDAEVQQNNWELFLQLGSEPPKIIRNGALSATDVTCEIRSILTSPSGFVRLEAGVAQNDGVTPAPIPKGGFDITVIVAAKKGRKLCN